MAYLTGEARARLDAFQAVTVKHARLQEADQALSLVIEEHTDATHVLLCGPGGVGKSTGLTGVTARFTREETHRDVLPIVVLEPIPSDTGPYVRLDYYRQILTALKGHILVKEIFVNVAHLMAAPTASRSRPGLTDWLDMREAAEQALVRSQVKAVLIDEGHRLMQGSGRYTTDEQLEWLKSLTHRTNVLHVLAGPYALFPFRNTSGQLVRRGRDLHFPRDHVEEQEERKACVAAVKYRLDRMPLTCDLEALLKRWRWFAEGRVGGLGMVKTWLVDAVAATLAQGGTSLPEDMLTRTMLHPAKRVSLELEARAGEHKVETNNIESAKQLQLLHRAPGKAGNSPGPLPVGSRPEVPHVAQTAQTSANATPSLSPPQVAPKPTKPRAGQRGPGRDPVGETSAPSVRKAPGCSCTEVIEVIVSQMKEASVTRCECPTCLAVRDLQPKGDSVKFPWHPRRTTHTPNQGLRWVKRESAWRLSA